MFDVAPYEKMVRESKILENALIKLGCTVKRDPNTGELDSVTRVTEDLDVIQEVWSRRYVVKHRGPVLNELNRED